MAMQKKPKTGGKFFSVKYKITLPIVLTLLVGMVAGVLILYFSLGYLSDSQAKALAQEKGKTYANQLSNTLDSAECALNTLLSSLTTIINMDELNFSREGVESILLDTLPTVDNAAAIFVMMDHNTFDDLDDQYIRTKYGTETGRMYIYVEYTEIGTIETSDSPDGSDAEYEWDYYCVPVATQQTYLSEPYYFEEDGYDAFYLTLTMPIIDAKGHVLGVVGVDFTMDSLYEMFGMAKIYDTGYITITDSNNFIVYSPIHTNIGEEAMGEYVNHFTSGGNHEVYNFTTDSQINGRSSLGVSIKSTVLSGTTPLQVTLIIPYNEINKLNNMIMYAIILAFILIAIAITIVTIRTTGRIIKPLKMLTSLSDRVATGDFSGGVPEVANDEFGQLAQGYSHIIKMITDVIADIHNLSVEHENGNMEYRIHDERYEGAYNEVAIGVNSMVSSYVKMLNDINIVLNALATGNFRATVPNYPGSRMMLTNSVNTLKRNLSGLKTEIETIITAVKDGRLDTKTNSAEYEGEWNALLKDIDSVVQPFTTVFAEIEQVMNSFKNGNLDVLMTGKYKGNFLVIKDSINNILHGLSLYIKEITAVLSQVAANNLDVSIDMEFLGEFGLIKESINTIIGRFNDIMADLSSATEQVAGGAKIISQNNVSIANGAKVQSESMNALNDMMHSVTNQISSDSQAAERANAMADATKLAVDNSNKQMQRLLSAMQAIEQVSNNINLITKSIDDISFQINILALNASIEAARAGQHGRGFTVVANQVKELSGQAQQAAADISELVEDAIKRIKDGTIQAEQAARLLSGIVGNMDQLNGFMNAINVSAQVQVAEVSTIEAEIDKIYQVVNETTASLEEATAASEELASQSDTLKSMAAIFTLRNADDKNDYWG